MRFFSVREAKVGKKKSPIPLPGVGSVRVPSTRTPPVDNTDWLKTVAIIAVAIGHFGHFFMEDDHWWAVFGRVAAPTFFFFQGYAESRTIPLNWIWLGVILNSCSIAGMPTGDGWHRTFS